MPPVQVDDVVQVAGASALAHRPQLLGKHLFERVAANQSGLRQAVRVGVTDRAQHRRPDDGFGQAQVDLDARGVGRGARSSVVDAALEGPAVRAKPQCGWADGKVDSRRLADPCEDARECACDRRLAHRWPGQDGEIEILGEPICLEVALLETCAALERPPDGEFRIQADPPRHPAEDVVLLHHVLAQPPLADARRDVAPPDHSPISTLIRKFHRVTTGP